MGESPHEASHTLLTAARHPPPTGRARPRKMWVQEDNFMNKGRTVSTMTPSGSDSASRVTSCASPTLELYEILRRFLQVRGMLSFVGGSPYRTSAEHILSLSPSASLFPSTSFSLSHFPSASPCTPTSSTTTTRDCAACGHPFGWGLCELGGRGQMITPDQPVSHAHGTIAIPRTG